MNEELQKLYKALLKKGYTTEDIGDESTFATRMGDESNRKELYDYVSGRGDFRIGDYDQYEQRLAGKTRNAQDNAATHQDEKQEAGTVIQEVSASAPTPTLAISTHSQKEWEQMPTDDRMKNAGNVITGSDKPWTMEQEASWSTLSPQARQVIIGNEDVYNKFEGYLKNKAEEEDPKSDKYVPKSMPMFSSEQQEDTTPDGRQQNRIQVSQLSAQIDDKLSQAYGRSVGQFSNRMENAKDKGFMSLIGEIGMATQGASPGDMQSHIQGYVHRSEGVPTQEAMGLAKEIKDYETARNGLKEAQRIIGEADHNAQSGTFGKWLESSFAGGAARGFGQKLFDASTWDMGVSDISDNAALLSALHAFDKGEPLTDSQQALLDAKAVELATHAYFGSSLGRGYKAGNVTAESIPFMIEMCLNPASSTGNAAANHMSRYAIKRFGKQALKNNAKSYMTGKVAARVAGDMAGSAVMAATTGAGRVTANAIDRISGDIRFDTDENGLSVFAGHTEGDDAGTAFGKAFAATTIENYSEMVGEYFSPVLGMAGKAVSKGLDKIGMKSVNKFISDVAATDVARLVTDFEKHSKWNGLIGEYAEEVAGGIMNALVVGDQTLDTNKDTGVFNLDQNIDTFLGVSLMGGFLSGVKTTGYRTPKYRARKEMEKKDNEAALIFGSQEKWGEIRNTLAFGNEDDTKSTISAMLGSDQYTENQKKVALEYAKTVEGYRGMLQGEQKRRTDENTDPDQVDLETSFDNGYSLEDQQELNDAKNMLDYQREQLKKLFGLNDASEVDDYVGDPLKFISEQRALGYTQDDLQQVTEYANAKATYDGVIQHVQDDIDGKIAQSDAFIDGNTNEQGKIQPATMSVDDRQVYVISGRLVMNEDGTGIDLSQSDEFVVIRDAQTGKLETTNPHNVFKVGETIDANAQKQLMAERIRQEEAQKAVSRIEGALPFNAGDTYSLTDEGGNVINAQVVANPETGVVDNGDGTINVTFDGVNILPMAREQIQQMADATNLARLAQYEENKVAMRTEAANAEQEANRPVYELNDEVTLRTPEGGTVRGSISAALNEDGLIEVYTEQPLNGNKVNMFTQDELDNMLAEKNGEPVSTNFAENVEGAEELQESPVSDMENNKINPGPAETEPMPMIGEGEEKEPDFASVSPARAYTYIYNEAELTPDEANAFVEANVKEKKKALDKVKKAQPKMGTSIAKYRKEQQVWQKKVDAAQQEADYWDAVKAERMRINAEEASRRKEEQAKLTAEAIAEEQARKAEEQRKADEQAQTGSNNVAPEIRDKWTAASKVEGNQNEIVLPDGEKLPGKYVLVESGAASASHNAMAGFAMTEGFPVDEKGMSVNDRDYERDSDAQAITQQIASAYDSRALQTPVVVSNDGVVLSGNGRTMAGELAAAGNTDAAYVDYLKKYSSQFGFTKEQVASMQHPRVVFVPDSSMPYTAETFAKFNQREMKSQSKTEQAVKMGKVVDDATFNRIVRKINAYDTLGDFYADAAATRDAIKSLQSTGVVSVAEMAELFDGDSLSAQGREVLENMLIGKAFESNPDAIRQITAFKSVRQSVITALAEISNNIMLGEEYSLEQELSQAVALVYAARTSGVKAGESASAFARQGNLFQLDEGATVADYTNATVMMLADTLNDNRVTRLKKALAVYNTRANESAQGQMDLFTGEVTSKQEILNFVNQLFKNGTEEQQQTAVSQAAEQRKAEATEPGGDNESIQQNGVDGTGNEGDGTEQSAGDSGTNAPGRTAVGETENEEQPSIESANAVRMDDISVRLAEIEDRYIELDDKEAQTGGDVLGLAEIISERTSLRHEQENLEAEYKGLEQMQAESEALAQIEEARGTVDTNPTEAQKEAGNYKKGHIKLDGYDISIENPKGSERSGVDANGQPWSITMNNDYGYIRGTKAVDGDHIDIFLSDNPTEGNVFVVDQLNEKGSFDESKVMYGFPSLEDARTAYLSNYDNGWESRIGAITEVSKDEFKKWIDSSTRKTKPFSEYKSVNPVALSQENGGEVTADSAPMQENNGKTEVNLPQNGTVSQTTKRKVDKKRAVKIKKARYELMDARRELSMAQSNPLYTPEERQVKQDRFDKAKKDFHSLFNVTEGSNPENGNATSKTEDTQQNEISPVEAAREKLEDIEQEWEDKILDYIAEHYPTQATVSAQTTSPEGLKERKAMKKDENLKKMREEADAAFTAADEKVASLFEKENDDIRFREVEEDNGNKSLVGLHNISEEKLRKALRLGGFANPSAAVIDISKQSHEGYGAISLVLPSSLIDKKTGRNAGTWSQDAWTPTYPPIERQFSAEGSDAFAEDMMKLTQEMQPITRQGMNNYMDGRDAGGLSYMFLHEQGKAPELARVQPVYPESVRKEVSDATNGTFSLHGLKADALSLIKDMYLKQKGIDAKDYAEAIKVRKSTFEENLKKVSPNSLRYKKYKSYIEDIDEYGFDYRSVSEFVNSVKNDMRNAGNTDERTTIRNAQKYIEDNGLQGEFSKWVDGLNDKYGIKEVLFDGFTPSGNRKYIPSTLENVSKFMRKEGRNAATGISVSFQNFAAGLLKAHGSLKNIRKEKGKLTTDYADVDAFRDKWSKVFYDLGEKLQPDAKEYDDYGLERLMEASQSKNPKKYIKDEYGINFHDEDVQKLNEMTDAIRNEYPAMYFETKFERPVYLEEFAAAIVPDNADKGITDAMGKAGLKVFIYKNGDEASRNGAVKKASEIKGVRFRADEQMGNFEDPVPELERISSVVDTLSESLHTPVERIISVNELPQGEARRRIKEGANIKGWYSTSGNKVYLYMPNITSIEDAQATILHEVVAHKGLRELFGKDFDTFLDNVFNNASEEVRKTIVDMAGKNRWNFRVATEEYLASLAEDTNFENIDKSWWDKIKDFFMQMLAKVGIELDFKLSDNELRYILWKSYMNLKKPGSGNILGMAEDIAMQVKLEAGNYSKRPSPAATVATDEENATADDSGIRFRDGDELLEKNRAIARALYERRVSTGVYQIQEAFQDSMLGLKEVYKAIGKAEGNEMNIEDVPSHENAYMAENALSSRNQAEMNVYKNLVFKPLLDEVAKIDGTDAGVQDLIDYMMAKHGLERNLVMAERDAKNATENAAKDAAKTKGKSFDKYLKEYRQRDYAGLTALTGTDNVSDAESAAQDIVDEYEANHDTAALWEKTNASTKATLSKMYESGLLDKKTYEQIRAMYKYYIPLRGWDEKTSDEAYGYLRSKDGAFNAPIRTAKGRSSKADNPLATIANMAESAIMQGNRNLMKQKFLNYVLNHPSDLVSVNRLWLQYNEVNDEWIPVFADIAENDTPEAVEQKVADFEEKMSQLAKDEPNKYKQGKDAQNIPYKVVKENLKEHQVLVKRGGTEYVLTINGNPRAAQALNGLTNPDNNLSGFIGDVLKTGEWVNRQLSGFYTTRNPDFVVSNFIRDAFYANSMVWVKEKPSYALRFNKNFGKVNPKVMYSLLAKFRKGELDMNNKMEKAFHLFMMNGGETGYANLKDVEKQKKAIRKELRKAGNNAIPVEKAWDFLGERLDDMNRAVENCARFAAFITSREMGRSIERSVWDAKEISVNFNKKGAGAKFYRATGQTFAGNTISAVAGSGRALFVFWNAAIQGTYNVCKNANRHPKKFTAMTATMFLLGAIIPALAGDGDDENAYYNLPEYVRRSNIMFRFGGQWVSIPLPVEYRMIYGLGEFATSTMSGKEHLSGGEIAVKIAEQFSQALPLDIMEGGGGFTALVPSAVKPLAEVSGNRSWTGMPIYKKNDFNKNMPEWTKAYKSANKQLVGLSRILNEMSGGDKYMKGAFDINPAKVEYMLKGYFGGYTSTADKLVKMGETVIGKRDFEWRNMLLANRILKSGDERTAFRKSTEEYFKYLEEYDRTRQRLKGYENEDDLGILGYAEKIDFLENSPEYERYEIMGDYKDEIADLRTEMKETGNDEERKEIEYELNLLISELVKELHETEKK